MVARLTAKGMRGCNDGSRSYWMNHGPLCRGPAGGGGERKTGAGGRRTARSGLVVLQVVLDREPHGAMAIVAVLAETEPGGLGASLFVAGAVHQAEIQIPQGTGPRAVRVIDEQRLVLLVLHDLD